MSETEGPQDNRGYAPAWVQSVLPDEIVRQRSLGWPDFHPEDFCHRCGQRNMSWFTDYETFQSVGGDSFGGGIICPSCLATLHVANGAFEGTWEFRPSVGTLYGERFNRDDDLLAEGATT